MSDSVFPALPGLKWDVVKKPEFSTNIKQVTSGKELRAAYWSYPRWHFSLSYELLRGASEFTELQTLMGFFMQRKGSFDSFLYEDPSDHQVTGQVLGIGNGTITAFQCVRVLGGYVEPIKNLHGTPTVYLDGVVQATGWTVSNGIITFSTPPSSSVVVSVDFQFYFRVRFKMDEAEFNQFMLDLWELKKCEMVSLK